MPRESKTFLGEIVDGKKVENHYAKTTHCCWAGPPNHYPHVTLDAFVVTRTMCMGSPVQLSGCPTGTNPVVGGLKLPYGLCPC